MAEKSHKEAPTALVVGALALVATKTHTSVTATLTGATPSVPVTFQFSMPGGGITSIPATTDSSGNATQQVTPSSPGTVGCQVVAPQANVVVGPAQTAKVS